MIFFRAVPSSRNNLGLLFRQPRKVTTLHCPSNTMDHPAPTPWLWKTTLAHLVFSVLMISCMGPEQVRIDSGESLLTPGASEYEKVLLGLTRKAEIYQNFEARIFVTGTYKSREWRRSYIQHRAQIYRLSPGELARLGNEHELADGQFHEFFIAVYTGDNRWNELDTAESMWRVSLVNDRNEEVLPLNITRVDTKITDVANIYPYLSVFHVPYTVQFPRIILETNNPIIYEDCNQFKLVLSSAVGMAELVWEITRDPKE